MTPEQFVYWLHGYFEISGETRPSPEEVKIIKEHLAKVFNKDVTPEPMSPMVVSRPFVAGLKAVGDPQPLTGEFGTPFVHYSELHGSC